MTKGAPATKPRTAAPAKGTPKVAEAPGRVLLENKKQLPPAAKPLRIPKLSPELEDILVEWEQKSAKVSRLEGKFYRKTYDGVFEVEKWAEGKFCFEQPDKGSLNQIPSKVPQGTKGKYPVKPGDAERWVCNGVKILKINDKDRQYEEVVIPEEDRGQNIRKSPLPFVFGMKAAEAKLRYRFVLVSNTDQQVRLKVEPMWQMDLANYKSAEVMLDRATFVPTAVKLYDNTGNKEDVYIFPKDSLTINDRTWSTWFKGDPINPTLTNYKKMIEPAGGAGAAPGTQLAPRPTDRRSAQVPTGGKIAGPRAAPQRTADASNDDEPPPRISTKAKSRVP